MSQIESYTMEGLELPDLISSLRTWLSAESFDSQVLHGEDNSTIIQVAKHGGWRKLVGMSTALNIVLRNNPPNLLVEVGAGRWIDKASVAAVSMVILWPLALTSAFGAWQQLKMPEKIQEKVRDFANRPRQLAVTISGRKKLRAAVEKVQAPSGVTVKVKRARTVEHTLSIGWKTSIESTISAGDKELICRSIQNRVEKENGRTYSETETIEYEVTLDGNKSTDYALVWIDTWCTGTITFFHSSGNQLVPFEFREQTDLQVIPGNEFEQPGESPTTA